MSLKDTPPKKAAVICCKKNAKMTVETVETVGATAPYAALIGHKLRPLLSDSQSALADCEQDVIQICQLLSRNGKLSLVQGRRTRGGWGGSGRPTFSAFFFFFFFFEGSLKQRKRRKIDVMIHSLQQRVSLNKGSMIAFIAIVLCRSAAMP